LGHLVGATVHILSEPASPDQGRHADSIAKACAAAPTAAQSRSSNRSFESRVYGSGWVGLGRSAKFHAAPQG
jgi:hypothetical protein